MPLSEFMSHRAVVGAIGAGAIAGTLLSSTAGTAAADPTPRPPNCSAADVAGVAAGVANSLTTYLFTHPDVNAFYTGLQDQPKDQIGGAGTELLQHQSARGSRTRKHPLTAD